VSEHQSKPGWGTGSIVAAATGGLVLLIGLGVLAGCAGRNSDDARAASREEPAWSEPIAVGIEGTNRGVIRYHVGAATIAEGEAELGKKTAELVKAHGRVSLQFKITNYSGIMREKLDAAKTACEAAGATVAPMPPFRGTREEMLAASGGRKAAFRIRVVGVRDGVLQYRLAGDGPPVEGEVALTAAFRRVLDEEERRQGGFLLASSQCDVTPGLALSSEQRSAVFAAMRAAGPEVGSMGSFGADLTEGRFEKAVEVPIAGLCADGNRYLFEGQALEGEAALAAALQKALADHRAGKEQPALYALRVRLKIEAKPGITVTEEQIALARKTIAASGVEQSARPTFVRVPVEIVGVKDGALRFKLGAREVEGEAAFIAALRAKIATLAEDAGQPVLVQLEMSTAPGVGVPQERQDAAEKALRAVQEVYYLSRKQTVPPIGPVEQPPAPGDMGKTP
jgi:hypothetical protein